MKRWVLVVLPLLLCCGLLDLLPPIPFEIAGRLAFGWVPFLNGVLPEMTIDWAGVETAVLSLAGLGIGLHYFCRWLHGQIRAKYPNQASEQRWQARWTIGLLAVIILMFIAGIAAVGLTHQTVWLANSP